MVLLALASRRLFALSGHSNIAGQVPALAPRAAETMRYVSQRLVLNSESMHDCKLVAALGITTPSLVSLSLA
jgi:hypothetical protein